MVYFKDIQPTKHYLEHHEKEVAWSVVVEMILVTKNPRKKGNKFEIVTKKHYLLFEIQNKTLYVINAKNIR